MSFASTRAHLAESLAGSLCNKQDETDKIWYDLVVFKGVGGSLKRCIDNAALSTSLFLTAQLESAPLAVNIKLNWDARIIRYSDAYPPL